MRINHNIAALNTYNQLNQNNKVQQQSLEKLSSGLRINSAADDAAGLAISEKMRGQIQGLEKAKKNAQDGISMIQTAEGSLNESHSILQRMRELAVQSANDTNTEADRAEIQEEVNKLAEELKRIGNTTEFNTKKLLNGEFEGNFHIGANEDQSIKMNINDMRADALGVAGEPGAKFDVEANLSVEAENLGALEGAVGELSDGAEFTKTFKAESIDEVAVGDQDADGIKANYALKNDNDEIVAVSENGENYQVLEQATEYDQLNEETNFATDSSDNVKTIQFDDPVKSGDVDVTMNISQETTSNKAQGGGGTGDDATTDSELGAVNSESKYTIVNFDSSYTVSGENASDITANYGWADEDGKIVAVSESGDSYTALNTATAEEDLGDGNLIKEDSNDEPVEFGGLSGATSGWIETSATGDDDFSNTDEITAVHYKIDGNVTFSAKASVETELENGTYEVVTEEDFSTLESDEYGLQNEDGELVALSSDGKTWESLDGRKTLLETDTAHKTREETIEVGNEGGIDVSTQSAADNAIGTIDSAIEDVSSERSKLGAYQNRLEHTINNLGTAAENLTAAESRIRDVDYAEAA